MFDTNKLAAIHLGLASPAMIESWADKDANGNPLEVTRAETVNYRSQKPEKDGLFCEKIFGPTKDYECACGKYKKKVYAGTRCEKCGVLCTTKSVRREKMSFIKLAAPVTHIWYLKGSPSRIAEVLGAGPKSIEEVVYFVSHIVLNTGGCPDITYKEVLNETEATTRFQIILVNAINNGLIVKGTADYDTALGHLDDLENLHALDFDTIAEFLSKFYVGLEFGIGAEAIEKLLSEVDLEKEIAGVNEELNACKEASNKKEGTNATISQKEKQLAKRLEILEAFKSSGNKPEWMVLTNLPVIPPDLRPMLPLDGSRFASADLNELYRRVIQRNNALKQFMQTFGTTVQLINQKRLLQEAVDALIDNGKRQKSVVSQNNRPLKSLSAALKGKQGRFRQNLLGKRVDYSGRSVIAVGPTLRMDECGIPREMAVQLFKPFIARRLVDKGFASSVKIAESEHIENNTPQMWTCLEEIVKEHPVLLNRNPTLHRLGIQAFHPRLVDGRAIRLFPLATTAYNADFDGDQMNVHVPLSNEAIWEAENLMLGSKNILGPKDGQPIVTPSKDMLLGNYYLTMEETVEDYLAKAKEAREQNNIDKAEKMELYAKCEGKVFTCEEEVLVAYQTNQIHLHNRIAVRGSGMHNKTFTDKQNESYLVTTAGKIIFNQIFDKSFPYLNYTGDDNYIATPDKFFLGKGTNIKEAIKEMPVNKPFTKKNLTTIIDNFLKMFGVEETSEMLNKLKDQGFMYSTKAAVTVSLFDIVDVEEKDKLIQEAEDEVDKYQEAYEEGLLTDAERHNLVLKKWDGTTKEIGKRVAEKFTSNPRNPFFMMSESGAGGKTEHLNQLAGMKGSMSTPSGEIIELPIKSCYKNGLTVTEFFNSTHGTRKGGADTALKTADSGYLTRRLVDVGQDIIVREEDCGCKKGIVIKTIIDTNEFREGSASDDIIEPFRARIVGRFTMTDVLDEDGKVIVPANTLITETLADAIEAAHVDQVEIRSTFTCKTKNGVCQKCYGTNLATSKLVAIGDAVGIMAAQSIGEPGTQLTMRNFNTGGVAGGTDITEGLPRIQELFECRPPKGQAKISEITGTITEITQKDGKYTIVVDDGKNTKAYDTVYNAKLAPALIDNKEFVLPKRELQVGDKVLAGQRLTVGSINPRDLLSITKDRQIVENYILSEIQKVYLKNQKISISDKHIEIMVRQMFKKAQVLDNGSTNLEIGSKIPFEKYEEEKSKIKLSEGQKMPVVAPIVLGISKAALDSDSFLSAASFQETTKVLTDATIKGKIDKLMGLKENVIVGKLIPCGTGLYENPRFATDDEDLK